MRQTQKCQVKDCPGVVEISTNGLGATVATCRCCELRERWRLKHLPEFTRVKCEVCEGAFLVKARGAGRAKHCPACRPIAQQIRVTEYGKKKKAAATSSSAAPELPAIRVLA
jgi:hypothetical protein